MVTLSGNALYNGGNINDDHDRCDGTFAFVPLDRVGCGDRSGASSKSDPDGVLGIPAEQSGQGLTDHLV